MAGFAVNIEVWRLVDNYNNYEISSHGRIRNNKTDRILIQSNDGNGYKQINLSKDGVKKKYKIHSLVARAFCENPNNYPCIDHISRDKTNNMFTNLRYATYSMNRRNMSTLVDNVSGKNGVSYVTGKNSWRVRWMGNDNIRHSKSFSEKQFGDNQAKALAIKFRRLKDIECGYLN